ncbi:MAG: PadR family transcriptional regulator [Nitrososphaeria archaeon]
MVRPLERLESSLTLNNLWLYSLRLLSERPMFSRELHGQIRERYNIGANVITIYSVLYRLERGGYIKKAGNYRKYYEVTEKGKNELRSALELMKNTLRLLQ